MVGAAMLLAIAISALGASNAEAVPPTASFSVNPTLARVGSNVSFSGSASATAPATMSTVRINFGDGVSTQVSGSSINTNHQYSSAGNYGATMTATDSTPESFTTAAQTVSVYNKPTAAFTWTPDVPNVSGQPSADVLFNASQSSDPAGQISRYDWNFGDGSTGVGATPSHAYASSGNKTVTLTITAAADGATATLQKTVRVNATPVAKLLVTVLDADKQSPGQNGSIPIVDQKTVLYAGGSSDTDNPIAQLTFSWDLIGDLSNPNPTWTNAGGTPYLRDQKFPTAGPKNVRVKVNDPTGAFNVATATFRVDALPVPDFTISNTNPKPNDTVTLTSTATDPDPAPDKIVTTAWELSGDNPPKYDDATGTTVAAVYGNPDPTPKEFSVRMKVTDTAGAFAELEKKLTVQGTPGAPPPPPGGQGNPPAAPPTVITTPITNAGGTSPSTGSPSTGGTSTTAPPQGTTALAPTRAVPGVRVQMAGNIFPNRTRVTLLLVVAPPGAAVKATCASPKAAQALKAAANCPAKALRRTVGSSQQLRLGGLQKTFKAGTKLTITVAKPGYMTRHIQFTIRGGQPPVRREACVTGKNRTGSCPA